MVAFVLSIGLLIGLMFKRKEHPTNMYLMLAFVSNPSKKHVHVIFSYHHVNQVFNQELKTGHLRAMCLVKFLKDFKVKFSLIFFAKKWASTGHLDTLLAKDLDVNDHSVVTCGNTDIRHVIIMMMMMMTVYLQHIPQVALHLQRSKYN